MEKIMKIFSVGNTANGKVMNKIAAFLLVYGLVFSAFAQSGAPMTTIEEGGKQPNPILDTVDVPAVVRNIYIIEYPTYRYSDWYGYPTFTESSDWYTYDPDKYTPKGTTPEYYVSEYNNDGMPNRVLYTKTGKKISSHRHLKANELPAAVSKAFEKSSYVNWQIVGGKLEIINHNDKSKVYKITVKNNYEKHSLFYDEKGKLMKDKKIKM